MKKTKSMKRALGIIIVSAMMLTGLGNVSAEMFFKEDFTGTQHDIFGEDLKSGEIVLNADTVNVDNVEAITFFSIEDEMGHMKKIGKRGNYHKMGFRKALSEDIIALNRAKWEAENPIDPESGEPAEPPVFSDTIDSGVWNFDLNYSTLQGDRVYFSLKNNGTEILRLRTAKWAYNIGIFIDAADEALKAPGGVPESSKFACVTKETYGNAWAWETGDLNEVRMQFDITNNKLNLFRYFGNKWVKINVAEIDLANYGVDITGGFDEIRHDQTFHYNTNNECISSFDYIKIANAEDGEEVLSIDFDDATKETWWDYGFESTTEYGTAYMKDGGLYFKSSNNRVFTIDKSLNEPKDSGIWAVDYTFKAFSLTGGIIAPSAASGSISNQRDFIEFMNGSEIALGLGTAYVYPHEVRAFVENNVVFTTKYLNQNIRKPNGTAYEFPTNTGARFKIVLDLDNDKLYMYFNAVNVNGMVLLNPDGYDLAQDFTIDKVRLKSYVVPDRTSLAGYTNFEIYKLDSTDSLQEPAIYKNGEKINPDDWNFVAQNDTLTNEITLYTTPGTEKTVKFITAVYDENNNLVSAKLSEKTVTTGLEVVSDDTLIDSDVNGYTIKTYSWDNESIQPYSKSISLDGIYPITN